MSTTPKSGHLDKDEVKNRLQDPTAFLTALGLLPDGPYKKSYTINCLWCGKKTLSIWLGRDSVIGCCRKGLCSPGDIKTWKPFDIIAKVKGWAMSGPDFNTKVLPFADQIGRTSGSAQPAQTAPQAAQKASPPAVPAPAAPQAPEAQPEAPEDDEPISLRLHPDRTPDEWAFVSGLGLDPHTIRRFGWRVLEDRKDQPAKMRPHIRAGYTLWRNTFGASGDYSGWCALLTWEGPTDPWVVIPDDDADAVVLANEFGELALEVGPNDLSAWPEAEHQHPVLYLTGDPHDFARAEALLQPRLLPLLGLLGKELPATVAARIPPAARKVLLHTGQATESLRKIAEAAGASLLPLIRLFAPPPSALSTDEAVAMFA